VEVPPEPGEFALGELLKRYRLVCGLSQEELGERAGVSPRAVGDIERGRSRSPHRKTVGLLAAALGIEGKQHAEFLHAARLARSVLLRTRNSRPRVGLFR
jgi:transcriptional regulator with XRE-family HTH domain